MPVLQVSVQEIGILTITFPELFSEQPDWDGMIEGEFLLDPGSEAMGFYLDEDMKSSIELCPLVFEVSNYACTAHDLFGMRIFYELRELYQQLAAWQTFCELRKQVGRHKGQLGIRSSHLATHGLGILRDVLGQLPSEASLPITDEEWAHIKSVITESMRERSASQL